MPDHFFISYSSIDGVDFALKLADELAAGPPEIPVWVDKRDLHAGEDWDEQIVEAIKTCKSMIFVMTKDSVTSNSVCKNEWVRALKYKKPIIPLLVHQHAELPFRLGSREYINFTGSYNAALAKLRKHLSWMDSSEGQLQALKYRLEDARRELPRADSQQQGRIREEITELERQIEQQQTIITNPKAAAERVQQSIERGLELVRKPDKPVSGITSGKFINLPPLIAPTWFQDRHVETRFIGDFLKDDALRLVTIVGRGGIGKTAMVCRLLRSLESGLLPDDGGPLPVDGIVYLSDARSFHRVNVPDLYAGLTKLLPEEVSRNLDTFYKNPQTGTREKIQVLLTAFPRRSTVVLLDNFEDTIDIETGRIKDSELDEALRALLELPPHGLKVIITTRVAPSDLALVEPGRQRRLDLDIGLEYPFAENILREMDIDGRAGLRDAPESMLTKARERTRGYPRALEHLFGIISADRDTSLQEILDDTKQLLPEKIITVLVGEAFSRLDLTAQRVMQALAVYRYPVSPAAVDYLLQSYVPGVDSSPVLSRLVNMQFVHRDAGRYYLHQVDRDYAISRIPEGKPTERKAKHPPFSQFALQHRAAEWFKQTRKPRETWKTLEDLAAQLSEFELRCEGKDYDTAAKLLLEIDTNYLILWGHYRLVTELHERLQGKISDPILRQRSIGNLGIAQDQMGQFQQAIAYYKQALSLAQTQKDWNESAWLNNLGLCYYKLGQIDLAINFIEQSLNNFRKNGNQIAEAQCLENLGVQYAELGQISRAIEYHEQSLAIQCKLRCQDNEALTLCNLGCRYIELGQTTEALRYLKNALTIAKEIGYRYIVAYAQYYLGLIYLGQRNWSEANQQLKQAIEIADDTEDFEIQNEARLALVKANLFQEEIAAAREMAEVTRQYNYPLKNYESWILQGIITLLQGDYIMAQESFIIALNRIDELLTQTLQLYNALEYKGIALSGLALCENPTYIPAAKEAFKTARAINSDTGIVKRCLQLFDTLAKADTEGILAEVRVSAGGE